MIILRRKGFLWCYKFYASIFCYLVTSNVLFFRGWFMLDILSKHFFSRLIIWTQISLKWPSNLEIEHDKFPNDKSGGTMRANTFRSIYFKTKLLFSMYWLENIYLFGSNVNFNVILVIFSIFDNSRTFAVSQNSGTWYKVVQIFFYFTTKPV